MAKSTEELLKLMKSSKDYQSYKQKTEEHLEREAIKVDRALSIKLEEKNLKKATVISRSGLESHYAYQIFNGTKTPGRDKVIMLCLGMGLDVEETQQLLLVTGYAQLYARNERDNAILFALSKSLSVVDLNSLLYELDLDLLV